MSRLFAVMNNLARDGVEDFSARPRGQVQRTSHESLLMEGRWRGMYTVRPRYWKVLRDQC